MEYSKATEILNLTTPKSLVENAKMAASILKELVDSAPLKYKVACHVIINAAK
jgi:hypothetical protein